MPLAGVLRVLETQLTMSFLFSQHKVYGRLILKPEPALGHNYISLERVSAEERQTLSLGQRGGAYFVSRGPTRAARWEAGTWGWKVIFRDLLI